MSSYRNVLMGFLYIYFGKNDIDQFYSKYVWENKIMDLNLGIYLILKWTLHVHQKVTNHFD